VRRDVLVEARLIRDLGVARRQLEQPALLPAARDHEPDAASGLQSYPTGQTYTGSLSSTSNYTDGWLGFVTRKAPGTTGQTWANRYFDPGLPWGTWQVCADNGLTGTSARRAFLTVVNGDRDGTANYAVLDLSASPQTATCGPTSSAWPAPSATPTVVP